MTLQTKQPSASASEPQRHRLQLDLTPSMALLLDHVCSVTGASRASVALSALTDSLPGLLERADGLRKRAAELDRAAPQQTKTKRS